MEILTSILQRLTSFLQSHPDSELVTTYLFFIERKYDLSPVLFPKEKKIYQGLDALIKLLEDKGELWRETEIKISFYKDSVNAQTAKIYICPFTGKVFLPFSIIYTSRQVKLNMPLTGFTLPPLKLCT